MNAVHRLQAAICAAVLAALCGCASTPTARTEVPRFALDPAACVATAAALPVRVLSMAKPPTLHASGRFADLAGCVAAAGRPFPAALFALGAAQPPMQVRVELVGNPHGTLAAEVSLLDAHYVEVRRHPFADFSRRGLDRTLTFFINPAEAQVRYLLLRPDMEHVGEGDRVISGQRWATVIVTPMVLGAYADGVERIQNIPLTDVGELRISVTPYAPAASF